MDVEGPLSYWMLSLGPLEEERAKFTFGSNGWYKILIYFILD